MAIFSRVLAAIAGGYFLSNVVAILLAYLLSDSRSDAVISGVMLSFLIYSGAVIWVFSARTAWIAWLGLLLPGLVSAALVFLLLPDGLL